MKKIFLLIGVLLSLAACGGGDGSNQDQDSRIDFNSFVVDEISNTDPDSDPADVNNVEFNFDDEDESAFDEVLS